MLLNAYNTKTGNLVKLGDEVTDFRGDTATLVTLERANEIGRDGKVVVQYPDADRQDYGYARVWDLEVRSPEAQHIGAFQASCGSHGCRGCIH